MTIELMIAIGVIIGLSGYLIKVKNINKSYKEIAQSDEILIKP